MNKIRYFINISCFVMSHGQKILLVIILLVGISVRAYKINIPLLEVSSSRQCQTAMIARNFYKEGINPFLPKMDNAGNEPGIAIMEFGFLPMMTATVYKITGHIREWYGRGISIIFYVFAGLFLFALVKEYFDELTGLLALAIFSVLPLSILYTRTFQPESIMLFFTIGSILFTGKWIRTNHLKFFILGVGFLACALLAKATAFYILLAIFYLMFEKHRIGVFKRLEFWLYWLCALIVPFLWYLAGRSLMQAYHTFGEDIHSMSLWFRPAMLASSDFWLYILETLFGKALTPLGFVLVLGVLIKAGKYKVNPVFLWWTFGIGVYFLIFNFHVGTHRYYLLPACVIGAIFIAICLARLRNPKVKYLFLGIIILSSLAQISSGYKLNKKYTYAVEAGKYVQSSTPQDALIISTKALYYTDRKGWDFVPDERLPAPELIQSFEEMIAKGASYFLVIHPPMLDKVEDFKRYLEGRYPQISPSPKFYLYQVKTRLEVS